MVSMVVCTSFVLFDLALRTVQRACALKRGLVRWSDGWMEQQYPEETMDG